MASLKELRDRINSVKATQKITKAMQMVAAAKLRRAQESVVAARPYSVRLQDIMANVSAGVFPADMPLLMRDVGRDKVHLAIVCAADRGLCGGFNAQIIREARLFLRARLAERKEIKIIAVGRKSAEMLAREFGAFFIDKIDLSRYKTLGFEQARTLADAVVKRYEGGEFDICTLFYSEFKSVMQQEPRQRQLIPYSGAQNVRQNQAGGDAAAVKAEKRQFQGSKKNKPAGANVDMPQADKSAAVYEYEPNIAEILKDLALRDVSVQIFQALLENRAGEMGAKMTAMDNATRNAGTMINSLSVTFNRRRQARITTELIEIIAGAEAL